MKKTVLALSVLATIITSCGQQNVIVINDNIPPFSEKRLIATIYDGNINMTAPVYTLKSSGLNKSTVDITDIKQAFPEYKSIVFMEISEIDSDAVSSTKLTGTEKIRQQSCEYDVNRNGICDLARNIQAYTTNTSDVGNIVWSERHSCPINATSCTESITITKSGTVSLTITGKYSAPAIYEIGGSIQGSYTWTNAGLSSIVMKPGACNEAFVKTISKKKEGYYTADFYETFSNYLGRKPTGDYWTGKKPFMDGKGWKTC